MLIYYALLMCFLIIWFDQLDTSVFLWMIGFITVFQMRHWVFIYFYLEVANLFKMTFLTHSDDDFERLKERRRNLLRIRIVGYVVIFLMSLTYGSFALCGEYESETLWTIWCAEVCFVYITGATLTFYSF